MPRGIYIRTEKGKDSMSKAHLGVKRPDLSRKNHWRWQGGKPNCLDCGKKLSNHRNKRCNVCSKSRELHYRWIKDRSLINKQARNNPEYKQWVRIVKKLDKGTCRLKDGSCSGYNVAHHILSWRKYPTLRYKINNGITLCQFHHPKSRNEEIRLVPVLEKLIRSR